MKIVASFGFYSEPHPAILVPRRFLYRDYARTEPAPPQSPMDLYFSAIVESNDPSGGLNLRKCRTALRSGADSLRAWRHCTPQLLRKRTSARNLWFVEPLQLSCSRRTVSRATEVIPAKPNGEPWRAMAQE
jgi:hypothetical protein